MELKDVATVIAGYTFRGAIKHDPAGRLCVVQARNLVQGEPITSTDSLARVSVDAPGYAGHLKQNDVLLVARGMKAGSFRSTVFLATDDNVVASSSVHVIRVTSPDVLPEFLSLYLNSREGQNALSEIVTGSYIGALPRKDLEQVRIPVPVLSKQKTMVSLDLNIQRQQRILEREKEIRNSIISSVLKSAAYEK